MVSDVEVRDVPEQPALFVRATCRHDQIAETLGSCFGKVFQALGMKGAQPASGPFARWINWGESDCEVEAGAAVASPMETDGELVAGTVGGCKVATAMHTGPYEGLKQANHDLMTWVKDNGHSIAGSPWEEYIDDPGEVPAEKLRTVMYWPIA